MSKNITVSRIRQDEWVNPFKASAEELLAGALEETGLLEKDTLINGKAAKTHYQAYCKKKNLFQEATRLGSMLIKETVISDEQLNRALAVQSGSGKPLGEVLVAMQLCTAQDIENALSRQKSIREELFHLEQTRQKRRTLWNRLIRFLLDSPEKEGRN